MIVDESTDTARKPESTALFEDCTVPLLDNLHGAALRLTRNSADAEDLVQETMLKAFNNFQTFRAGTHLRAWLYRIMHNTWIDNHRRSLSRPKEHPSSNIADWQHVARHDPRAPTRSSPVEVDVLEALPDHRVVKALEALPEGLRKAIYYADVEGYRYREIAEILNIPEGTVMSRLHSARRTLRKSLADLAHEHQLG
jgi:RNA polymerase sigma-70 factor, ECF subfamily